MYQIPDDLLTEFVYIDNPLCAETELIDKKKCDEYENCKDCVMSFFSQFHTDDDELAKLRAENEELKRELMKLEVYGGMRKMTENEKNVFINTTTICPNHIGLLDLENCGHTTNSKCRKCWREALQYLRIADSKEE